MRLTTDSLEILAPRLTKAEHHGYISQIQDAWKDIAARGSVRTITRITDSCLEGATELAAKGVEVRISPTLDGQNLTYHSFYSPLDPVVVLNDRSGGKDRPVRLSGYASSRVFKRHFDDLWCESTPLESVLSDRIIGSVGAGADVQTVCESMRAQAASYDIDPLLMLDVRKHLAFKHGCAIVFIVGLPGAGKSYVRARLASLLRSMHIQVAELTDYVFAYRDFVHGSIKLSADRGSGFEADEGGAFRVSTEKHLQPALRALAENVWESANKSEVSLVEFARADIMAALREFGENIVRKSHIIYVQAPRELREARVKRRANPPVLQVSGLSISLTVSDNHKLPR